MKFNAGKVTKAAKLDGAGNRILIAKQEVYIPSLRDTLIISVDWSDDKTVLKQSLLSALKAALKEVALREDEGEYDYDTANDTISKVS